jgi:hypothetical protein
VEDEFHPESDHPPERVIDPEPHPRQVPPEEQVGNDDSEEDPPGQVGPFTCSRAAEKGKNAAVSLPNLKINPLLQPPLHTIDEQKQRILIDSKWGIIFHTGKINYTIS